MKSVEKNVQKLRVKVYKLCDITSTEVTGDGGIGVYGKRDVGVGRLESDGMEDRDGEKVGEDDAEEYMSVMLPEFGVLGYISVFTCGCVLHRLIYRTSLCESHTS